MGGEAQELGILEHPATSGAAVLEDDGLELIEEQLVGHAAAEGEGLLEAGHQGAHRLAGVELHPEEARVAEDIHHGKRLPQGRRTSAKSTWPWWPGGVSKRMIASGGGTGRTWRTKTLS